MAEEITVKTLVLGMLETNTYVVFSPGAKSAVIIDPAADPAEIVKVLEAGCLEPSHILLTHGHADHIGAVNALRSKYHLKTAIHSYDKTMIISADLNLSKGFGFEVKTEDPDIELKDGDILDFGKFSMSVIHTPGHSPGGIALSTKGMVFTGDTLFNGSVGRYDLQGSNVEDLSKSLKKLLELPDKTIVYPGHGPATTIGEEKKSNLLLKELAGSM